MSTTKQLDLAIVASPEFWKHAPSLGGMQAVRDTIVYVDDERRFVLRQRGDADDTSQDQFIVLPSYAMIELVKNITKLAGDMIPDGMTDEERQDKQEKQAFADWWLDVCNALSDAMERPVAPDWFISFFSAGISPDDAVELFQQQEEEAKARKAGADKKNDVVMEEFPEWWLEVCEILEERGAPPCRPNDFVEYHSNCIDSQDAVDHYLAAPPAAEAVPA